MMAPKRFICPARGGIAIPIRLGSVSVSPLHSPVFVRLVPPVAGRAFCEAIVLRIFYETIVKIIQNLLYT